MAVTEKVANDTIRKNFIELITKYLNSENEETLLVGSNEVAIPCVDINGNEKFLVLTFKVPTGSRDGEEYDGYELAEDYARKIEEKKSKAEEKAKAKAEKIAKDKAKREKAKAEKEARQKEKE